MRSVILILLLLSLSKELFSEGEAIEGERIEIRAKRERRPYEKLENKREIEVKDEKSLNEILRYNSGLNIIYYGDKFGYSTISIRGSSSSQLSITLNGAPLNIDPEERLNLSWIPIIGIRKVVIYKGIDLESGGVFLPGGRIDLVTDIKKKEERRLRFQLGSWISDGESLSKVFSFSALRNISIWNIKRLKENVWLSLGSEWTQSIGDYKFLFDNGTMLNQDDDRYLYRKNNGFNRVSFFSSLFLDRANQNDSLLILNRSFGLEKGIGGFFSIQPEKTTFYNLATLWQLIYNKKGRLFNRPYRLNLITQFHYQDREFKDIEGELGLGKKYTEIRCVNLSFLESFELYHYPLWIKEQAFLLSYIWKPNDRLNIEVGRFRWLRLKAGLKLISGFVITPKIQMISSYAFATTNDFALTDGEKPIFYYREVEKRRTLFYFTPHLGFIYQLNQELSLKWNIYYQMRAPSIIELFGNQGVVVPSSGLKPERGWSVESGVDWLWRYLNLNLSIYYRFVEDLIQFVQNSQSTFVAENIGKASFLGVELFLESEIIKQYLMIRLIYEFIYSKNLTPVSYLKGKRIPLTPLHSLIFSIELKFWRITLCYYIDFKAKFYLDSYNSYPVPYHLFHNIEFRYIHLGAFPFKLFIRIENLEDKLSEKLFFKGIGEINRPIAEVNGFPLPGRTFYFGIVFPFF